LKNSSEHWERNEYEITEKSQKQLQILSGKKANKEPEKL